MNKFVKFLKTYLGHLICKVGVIASYVPMILADDIVIVKGFSAFALLFFTIYMFLPIDGYADTLSKYKVFLKKEVTKNKELKYLYDKLEVLEGDIR